MHVSSQITSCLFIPQSGAKITYAIVGFWGSTMPPQLRINPKPPESRNPTQIPNDYFTTQMWGLEKWTPQGTDLAMQLTLGEKK